MSNKFTYNNLFFYRHLLMDDSIVLRHYQLEAIKKIDKSIEIYKDIRIKIPCGCGKTQIIYHYCKTNKNILILVPKITIAEQIEIYLRKILRKNINCYWTKYNKNNYSNIILSVYNSVDRIPNINYDMIFIDEAHHIIGSEPETETYVKTILELKRKFTVYLSATLDLETNYDYEYTLDQAINEGYLTDYEINTYDIDLFHKEEELVKIIKKHQEYKHIIIYCRYAKTANKMNDFLNSNDIYSDVVLGDTPKIYRKVKVKQFNEQKMVYSY